jgi:methyl-accepting chemotaxis protein
MTETNGSGKIDILIDQVGRLTEGLTDIKQLVERVAHTTEQQEQNISRLTTLFEQQSQRQAETTDRLERQAETTDRLVRIVESLLEQRS